MDPGLRRDDSRLNALPKKEICEKPGPCAGLLHFLKVSVSFHRQALSCQFARNAQPRRLFCPIRVTAMVW
jgi:hypothetical protein